MTEDLTEEQRAYETEPARSAYHDALPIGERLSAQSLLESPFFGFEGDVRMKPLEPMLVPESAKSLFSFGRRSSVDQYLSATSPVASPGCQSEGQRRSVRSAFNTRRVSSTLRPTLT